jgi:hypothetical protein
MGCEVGCCGQLGLDRRLASGFLGCKNGATTLPVREAGVALEPAKPAAQEESRKTHVPPARACSAMAKRRKPLEGVCG